MNAIVHSRLVSIQKSWRASVDRAKLRREFRGFGGFLKSCNQYLQLELLGREQELSMG